MSLLSMSKTLHDIRRQGISQDGTGQVMLCFLFCFFSFFVYLDVPTAAGNTPSDDAYMVRTVTGLNTQLPSVILKL